VVCLPHVVSITFPQSYKAVGMDVKLPIAAVLAQLVVSPPAQPQLLFPATWRLHQDVFADGEWPCVK
jgi:hypothetical protein